jgi:two-component system CheB/CheR fusion protein
MQVTGTEGLAHYLSHLRTNPGEAGALLQDLLISVTNFFRDREAFDAVEGHIPELFRNKKPGDSVRVWCAACATGEEAYSMAILLLEHARRMDSPPLLQVFGCDLDESAIQTARAGFYPETISADVSDERLRNFFVKEPGGYRVRRELREMVLFAAHDLLKDAPFSRMDLLSCRNLLIYLNREAQARALGIFNFALKPGALLFLGVSEAVQEASAMFVPVDKKYRIFRQRPVQRAGLPLPTGVNEAAFQRMLAQHERLKQTPVTLPGRSFAGPAQPSIPDPLDDEAMLHADALHFKLLGHFGPSSLVVNIEHEVLHVSENAHRFLQYPEGQPTRDVLRLIHPMLRADLRAAMLRAEETGEPVDVFRRLVQLPGGPKAVDMRVSPAGELAPGYVLIVLESHEPASGETTDAPFVSADLEPAAVVHQLERELTRAHANLRANIEHSEASTEELKASNEELQAMNEELRSAGEELETGREELQSVNEELTTVNNEFKNRVDELARANSDLHNLMSATQIATVFLDRELKVMRYTRGSRSHTGRAGTTAPARWTPRHRGHVGTRSAGRGRRGGFRCAPERPRPARRRRPGIDEGNPAHPPHPRHRAERLRHGGRSAENPRSRIFRPRREAHQH